MPGDGYQSEQVRALKSIDSSKYPDTNKDLEMNIRRLNSNVDYISSYMIIMQKGIDDASQNFIQQIQSFISDIIVLLAGGEPTGFDFGDLKYVLQGLGALFGFQGPFPLNLINAVEHFLFGYVIPLESFTDFLFDTIAAWAEEFGLPPEFINAVHDFFDALNDFADEFGDLFDALGHLFNVLIHGLDGGALFGPFASLWNGLTNLFEDIIIPDLKPILQTIAAWTTPFIEGLANVVQFMANVIDFLGDEIDWIATSGFNPITALINFITKLISNGILDVLDGGNIIGTIAHNIVDGFDDTVNNIINAVTGGAKVGSGIFADIFDAIFGVNDNANTALSPYNPAAVALDGRMTVLETQAGGVGNAWSDPFAGVGLGSNYSILTGAFTVLSSGSKRRVQATTSAASSCVYTAELFLTAQQYAQVTLWDTANGGWSQLNIMESATGDSYCGVEIKQTSTNIFTNVSIADMTIYSNDPVHGFVSRKVVNNIAYVNGTVIGIGFDPSTKQYVCYKNNNAIVGLSWIDAGVIVNTSSSGRHSGFAMSTHGTSKGASFTDYSAYDWV